jgi:alanine racemase
MIGRPTKAVIDLKVLEANYTAVRDFVGPSTAIMSIVKADAYGHGAIRCAERLERAGAPWFGVAVVEEAIPLRHAGITTPILCLGSFWSGQEQDLLDYDLTPVVFTAEQIRRFCAVASAKGRIAKVHVKIDTGMCRAGIDYWETDKFIDEIRGHSNLRITGLLTHFAAAESVRETDFTNMQINRFHEAVQQFRSAGHDPEWIDLANSPAAIGHPRSRSNLARIGGGLYGLLDDIVPVETPQPQLAPVMSLVSRTAIIRSVPRGDTVGYGRSFIAQRDSLIALVPIGYADGYPRAMSNVGEAVVRNRRVTVAGRISMDWTMFDVTDVENVAPNDEIILIGDGITAAEIARHSGTIGYEITCGISPRVPRVYVGRPSETV